MNRRTSVRPLRRQDENPNQWLLDFTDSVKDVDWKPGPMPSSPDFKRYLREGIANRIAAETGDDADDPRR